MIPFLVLMLVGTYLLWCVGEARKEEKKLIAQLAEEKTKLLGPAGGPEGGKTVIERLRQAGFTVREKQVAPRPYMLGWLTVLSATKSYNYSCRFCGGSFHELLEVVEDTDHSVPGAFLVVDLLMGFFCNTCGSVTNDTRDESSSSGRKRFNCVASVFRDIRCDNMFDIIDYLQSQAGKMDSTIANWLAQRKQLLEREAARLGDALARYESSEAKDMPADGPFREIDLPEPESVPKMLERDKQKKE